MFSLTDQLKRASVSITSNIAEGFGRWSYKEKAQFYHLSMGSLTEVENQITIAKDLSYIDIAKYQNIEEQIISVGKLLNRLISSTKFPSTP